METKKRALGIGLEQLFNNENLDIDNFEKKVYETATNEEIIEVNIDDLRPNPYQPRKNFDINALQELSESIKTHGVYQPIIIKPSVKGYEIIAGERRVRASKMAGLSKIPAIIRQLTDDQMMEIALLENLQRENLNALEEALAYKSLIEKLNITQEELSKKVGKSRSHITNILGILRLPDEVKQMIIENKLSMGHAKTLSKMENKDEIISLANKIIEEKLPVHDIEEMTKQNVKINPIIKKEKTNEYKYLEEIITEKLDTKVKIKDKKIEISFANNADLNRILEILDIKE